MEFKGLVLRIVQSVCCVSFEAAGIAGVEMERSDRWFEGVI